MLKALLALVGLSLSLSATPVPQLGSFANIQCIATDATCFFVSDSLVSPNVLQFMDAQPSSAPFLEFSFSIPTGDVVRTQALSPFFAAELITGISQNLAANGVVTDFLSLQDLNQPVLTPGVLDISVTPVAEPNLLLFVGLLLLSAYALFTRKAISN